MSNASTSELIRPSGREIVADRVIGGRRIEPEEAPDREYHGPNERVHPWAQRQGRAQRNIFRDCRNCDRTGECHDRRHKGLGFAYDDCESPLGRAVRQPRSDKTSRPPSDESPQLRSLADYCQDVLLAVRETPGMSTVAVYRQVGGSRPLFQEAVIALEEAGKIVRQPGRGRTMYVYLTPLGEAEM